MVIKARYLLLHFHTSTGCGARGHYYRIEPGASENHAPIRPTVADCLCCFIIAVCPGTVR